jgi:hypothetical protein
MDKESSHLLELGKRGAERRFRELMNELSFLIGSFPHHLNDAFDADELPVSFIIRRDSSGAQVRVVRRQKARDGCNGGGQTALEQGQYQAPSWRLTRLCNGTVRRVAHVESRRHQSVRIRDY